MMADFMARITMREQRLKNVAPTIDRCQASAEPLQIIIIAKQLGHLAEN